MKLQSIRLLTGVFLLLFFVACELPFSSESQSPTPEPSSSGSAAEDFSSALAKKSKANSEIFHEMFVVVYMREPKDRGEFGNWVDTLNQGASLEGVYNGLTHSEEYRRLEKTSARASEKAVKIFREEITLLEKELPMPTQLDNFGLASLFVLKRALGDEALKVIAAKEESPQAKLAGWYSKFAVHMTERNVDFGIALRNKPDEAFHLKWATAVSKDQIIWEVLNRLHRVLNEANK